MFINDSDHDEMNSCYVQPVMMWSEYEKMFRKDVEAVSILT